jgi:hypothetical protein
VIANRSLISKTSNTHVGSGDCQRLQSSEGADDLEVQHARDPGGVSGGVPRLEGTEEPDQTSRVGAQPTRYERHSAWFRVRTRFGQHATSTYWENIIDYIALLVYPPANYVIDRRPAYLFSQIETSVSKLDGLCWPSTCKIYHPVVFSNLF